MRIGKAAVMKTAGTGQITSNLFLPHEKARLGPGFFVGVYMEEARIAWFFC